MKNKGFTTTNKKQNENLFSFSLSAVGAKTRRGFTLIELLVVISIISLLSSIVLASVQDARNKAKIARFERELLQIVTAIELYRLDYDGDYPSTVTETYDLGSVISDLYTEGYFPNNTITTPPGYTLGEAYPAKPETNIYGYGVLTCGSATPNDSNYTLYFATFGQGSETSNFPLAYYEGVVQNNYHCVGI
jgi:prepilin-type N-terminal cleavage/methylation domain-containing protein